MTFEVKMQVIDLNLYLKCDFPQMFFNHFASKNELTGLSISETLLEYGLILLFSLRLLLFQNIIV